MADRSNVSGTGVDSRALALAMLEDVVDVVSDLQLVTPALAVAGDEQWRAAAGRLTWPGTLLLDAPVLDAPPLDGPGTGGAGPAALFGALAATGATEAVVVAGDAPDLPGLLLAKLFRGLLRADVAACPAEGGGLVALGARLPLPDWVVPALPDLDAGDALGRLAAAAPRRAAVHTGPGWHRVRTAADLGRLDPDLEGWPATREVLAALADRGG